MTLQCLHWTFWEFLFAKRLTQVLFGEIFSQIFCPGIYFTYDLSDQTIELCSRSALFCLTDYVSVNVIIFNCNNNKRRKSSPAERMATQRKREITRENPMLFVSTWMRPNIDGRLKITPDFFDENKEKMLQIHIFTASSNGISFR